MAVSFTVVWLFSLMALKKDLGKAKSKPKFTNIFSKSHEINHLSAARLLGTVLSGWLYQVAGLEACLGISAGFIVVAALISRKLAS